MDGAKAATVFSVVIPLYNKRQTIERAIRSVLNQTVQEFEIIVVDDGSTDSGPQVVEGIADYHIRLLHQENQGVSAARNRGIVESRFDLVAFLDADDEWRPRFLEAVAGLVDKFPHAALYATGYLFCQAGRKWPPTFRGIPRDPWEGILPDYFRVAARSDPPLWTSAVGVKKTAILAVGGFPLGVTSGEDLLTWARLALRYEVVFSAEPLAIFHLGERTPVSHLRRLPDVGDPVGEELQRLMGSVRRHQKTSFRHYLALWNKMRTSVLLRADRRSSALQHALRAVILDPLNWRHHIMVLFCLLPRRSSRWLFSLAVYVRRRVKHSR